MKTRLMIFVLLLWAVFLLSGHALAAGPGSITVTLETGGGTLTLYPVAGIQEAGEGYTLLPEEPFSQWYSALYTPTPELACQLASAVQDSPGITAQTGPDGRLCFDGLDMGLYLLVQHTAADGYYPISPFLVSIPSQENGEIRFSIDASPKAEPLPIPALPQTGQANIPAYLLTAMGISLGGILLVHLLRKRKQT